jgi:alkylation response protein AidB-like acyl-CoA dehydrogenase
MTAGRQPFPRSTQLREPIPDEAVVTVLAGLAAGPERVSNALLSEEEQSIRAWAHTFAEEHVRPEAARCDQERSVPTRVLEAAHAAGMISRPIPGELGGGGAGSMLAAALVGEEMAWGCVGIHSYLEATNMFISVVLETGTDEQKKLWLGRLCDTRPVFGSFACTEPGAGSDVANVRTSAAPVPGGWRLRGEKIFITNAGLSEVLVVVARVAGTEGHDGLSLFLVDGHADGVTYGPRARTMGWRASTNAGIFLDDVFVPDDQVLGEVGQGFSRAVRTFQLSRVEVAAASIGIARAALEYACEYAKGRSVFGRSISAFQGVAFPLADGLTRLHAARLLTWEAARAADRGEECGTKASMAKLFASEAAVEITSQAVQTLGGHGYVEDHPVEKWFRDARLETIEEGTSEVQRHIISRALIDGRVELD